MLLGLDDQRATVSSISEQLGVTTETVRRDLDVLERRGLLRRVRGGAELMNSTPFETALAARHALQFEDKITIARRVAEELPDDGVVILDSGSLTFVCAQAMPKDRPLVLVTNNLPAAQFLAGYENLRIMTLPGMIRGLTSAAVDNWTQRRLGTLSADLAIIGVNGLTTDSGSDDDQSGGGRGQAGDDAGCPTPDRAGHLEQARSELVLLVRVGVGGGSDHHRPARQQRTGRRAGRRRPGGRDRPRRASLAERRLGLDDRGEQTRFSSASGEGDEVGARSVVDPGARACASRTNTACASRTTQ